jgi:hypothetical protein
MNCHYSNFLAVLGLAVIELLWLSSALDEKALTLDPTILILGAYDYVPYQSVSPFTSRCVLSCVRAFLLFWKVK